jgi:hypothetical protein
MAGIIIVTTMLTETQVQHQSKNHTSVDTGADGFRCNDDVSEPWERSNDQARSQGRPASPSDTTVAAFVETYRAERDRLAKLHARDRRDLEKDLAAIDRKLAHIMTAIEDGDGELKPLLRRQKELSTRRRELEQKLPLIDKPVVALHPNSHQRYRQQITDLQAVLAKGDEGADEAKGLVRSLITKIVVTPEAERMGLEVFGDLQC